MKLNTSKLIFLNVILLSTLISLSVNNWLTMWMMMETALFMFIPLMSKNKIKDQSMKYFIIQSMSSYILIFSILWNSLKCNSLNNMITLISLMIKIGMPPFHIWKPEIMSPLKWTECMIMTTLIKFPPMVLINKMIKFKMLIIPITLSLLIGSVAGVNQLNLKKMMAYSSIFNLSWMTSAFMISKKIMILFIFVYSLLNVKTMHFFKKNNLIYINQMTNMPLKIKITLNLNLLSISGLPPLTGFYPKWVILNEMIKTSMFMSSMMILTSVISIFMYIQSNYFLFSNFMVKKKNNKFFYTKTFNILNFMFILLMLTFWSF